MNNKKNIFIFIFCIIYQGCGYNSKNHSNIILNKDYNLSSDCFGRGYKSSNNPIKGKLYFTFQTINDSLVIEVRDILGRKLYNIDSKDNNLYIEDNYKNEIYKLDSIISDYTLNHFISSERVNKFLCGIDPTLRDDQIYHKLLPSKNGSIIFLANQFGKNNLIDKAEINFRNPKISVSINITDRSFLY